MRRLMQSLIFSVSMQFIFGLTFPCSAAELTKPALSPEAEQMKSDLVGHVMGGREKSWKFESVSQIKELVINKRKEEPKKRVYSVTLTLHDSQVPSVYKAEAEVTYEQVGSKWEVKVVGLKSITKIE